MTRPYAGPVRFAYTSSVGGGSDLDADILFVQQVAEDHDITMEVVHWDDPKVDWSRFDLVVVRSCWDYVGRRDEFLAWADSVPNLQNTARTLRWNTDKVYLRELESAGVRIIPTLWNVTAGDRLVDSGEWVVKPTISAGSKGTARWDSPADVYHHSQSLQDAGRVSMTQPYIASVDDEGETAMMFFGGQFSHAVRKGPLLELGEGVRDDRDGRGENRARIPTERQHQVARQALDAATAIIGDRLLYARVDLVTADDGEPIVIELELTEPYFFFEHVPEGAANLVRAIESTRSRS